MVDLPFSHVQEMRFMSLVSKALPLHKLKQRNSYSIMICTNINDAVCGQVTKLTR